MAAVVAAVLLCGVVVGGSTREAGAVGGDVGPAGAPTHRVLAGDFTGDGFEDLLFFGIGSAPDELWDFEADSFETCPPTPVVRAITINTTATPIVGDFTGDNVDDIFWYVPGSGLDRRWDFNVSSTVAYSGLSYGVNGTGFLPVSGDLSNDGVDDIAWYAPGTAADSIWDFNSGGGHTRRSMSVNGTYRPIVGRFTPDPQADIFWYAPGSGRESIWGYEDSSFLPYKSTNSAIQVSGTYITSVTDSWNEDIDDIVFATPGPGGDGLWDFFGDYQFVKETLPGTAGEPTADGAFNEIASADVRRTQYEEIPPFGDLFFFDGVGLAGELLDFDVDAGNRSFSTCVMTPAPLGSSAAPQSATVPDGSSDAAAGSSRTDAGDRVGDAWAGPNLR